MITGVVKEIKNNENRVGLTPAGVDALSKAGHKVLVEAIRRLSIKRCGKRYSLRWNAGEIMR